MAASPLTRFLDYLRTHFSAAEYATATDLQLLERFVGLGNGEAFQALLLRHGPLVWAVCRGVLRSEHDVEDAFQATFLVFLRKASSIRKQGSLASWLHGVAHRIALKARATAERQRCHQLQDVPQKQGDALANASGRELRALIDEEVLQLPERFRAPVILCCLEGRTKAEAARLLGLKEGTLSSRLARGRQRLQDRLTRRGILVAAGSVGLPLLEKPAAVAASVVAATVRMARLIAAGEAAAAGGVSTSALALADGFLQTALVAKLKVGALVAIVLSSLATGVGLTAHQMLTAKPAISKAENGEHRIAVGAAAPPQDSPKKPRTDFYGDPLPPGVLARMGPLPREHVRADIAFSADGKTLISGGPDGLIQWWDAATGKKVQVNRVQRLQGENYLRKVFESVLAPGGKSLAMWDNSKEKPVVLVYDTNSGKEICALPVGRYAGPTGGQLVFSCDGKLLAAVEGDGIKGPIKKKVIRVWEIATGKERMTLPCDTNLVVCWFSLKWKKAAFELATKG